MKKFTTYVLVLSIVAVASVSFANPKCSHRLASSGNDLLKSTNPIKMRVAKNTIMKSGKESTRTGVK